MGCHYSFTEIRCSMRPYEGYFHAIPHVPDAALARSIVRRVGGASPPERRELVKAFGMYGACVDVTPATPEEADLMRRVHSGALWETLSKKGKMPEAEFRTLYAAWLKLHPEWR